MSQYAPHHWLVSYDICHRKRLRRVHRYLCKRAFPLQYSVFGMERSPRAMQQVMNELDALIDPGADAIRAYTLPERSPVWVYGRQAIPDGIILPDTGIFRLLQGTLGGSASPQGELFPSPLASHRQIRDSRREQSGLLPRSRGD